MSEEIKEAPTGELSQGDFKIKKKFKKLINKEPIAKVDFNKTEEKIEPSIVKVDLTENKVEEDKVEETTEQAPVIQEVTEREENMQEEVKETVAEYKEAKRDEEVLGKPLPENIEKLSLETSTQPGFWARGRVQVNPLGAAQNPGSGAQGCGLKVEGPQGPGPGLRTLKGKKL